MELFDLIRFFARCMQFVGAVLTIFSLPLWRGNPAQATLLVLVGVGAWVVGNRICRWAIDSDPTATPFIYNGRPRDDHANDSLLGSEGKVVSPLRPFGCIEIGGRHLEVVSEQEYIPAGEVVKIVARKGNRLAVRRTRRHESILEQRSPRAD
jgi:membrane protein implicated in regulation of membrane protease activity